MLLVISLFAVVCHKDDEDCMTCTRGGLDWILGKISSLKEL